MDLASTAQYLVRPGKGLLAADESTGTIGKRLDKHGLENTEEMRRSYRELLLTAPGLGASVSGVILFKETLLQSTKDGRRFVDVLSQADILPGIKVDNGLQPLAGGLEGESYTTGLEELDGACKEYFKQGARFTKWRAVYKVQPNGPSDLAIERNADDLAQYAVICQRNGLVPIVEPEILIEGDFDMARMSEVTERVLAAVVARLWHHKAQLEGLLLKPQMVVPGADYKGPKPTAQQIADATLRSLLRMVPPAVPGIAFLSGGLSEEDATVNLNAINVAAAALPRRCPWALTFSFGRALQASVLKNWAGNPAAVPEAQRIAAALADANSAAAQGKYPGDPHPSTLHSKDGLHETFRGHNGLTPAS